MSITFQLSRRDIIYASVASLLQQPISIAFFALMFLFISYQNWTGIPSDRSFLVKIITLGILELIPVVLIGGILFLLAVLIALSQRNRTLLTKQTLTLTDNLLICESEYVKSELKWKAVQRI